MNFKQGLLATAAAAVLAASGAASAAPFPDFTVDPDLIAGGPTFVADKITGNYVEVIDFTNAGTFTFSLRFEAGQFVAADGTAPLPGFTTRLGNDYGLYALVTGSGTFSTTAGVTTFNTDPGGTLQFFYDSFAAGITTFANTGAGITDQASLFVRNGAGADQALLASGAAVSGTGTLDPTLPTCAGGINCGSFGQSSSIGLSNAGRSFFTQPVPFYNMAFNSGQLNNFSPSGRQVINGSLDVVFNVVPEPSALALVGAALLGLGLSRRRSNQR